MNAFLLYAKKRRPQISTNHPTMRTGEISKVLSKEWQTMNKGEKQYYQDKAKKLKDNFNIRWPDYVYKRRPNNSRKKRRGNPSADSPVIEEPPSRRASVGADNAYGDESGAEDAEGSPISSSDCRMNVIITMTLPIACLLPMERPLPHRTRDRPLNPPAHQASLTLALQWDRVSVLILRLIRQGRTRTTSLIPPIPTMLPVPLPRSSTPPPSLELP
ncbi:hypothetical protein BS47DRAFT_359774 [Hydnum rufescens UP504]|uniref:HMG box domain-containing protein n=1 Tax=Hydnum rufescens UP504 TaxID=1448309 RepID=A0A9P6ALF7_9AGAM|nr:hypothetical protein BS47DRAFT_359774 [Hydnum rufescens UP504]